MGPRPLYVSALECAPLVRLTSKRETGKRAVAILERARWLATRARPMELTALMRRWIHGPGQRDDREALLGGSSALFTC